MTACKKKKILCVKFTYENYRGNDVWKKMKNEQTANEQINGKIKTHTRCQSVHMEKGVK